MCTEFRTQTAFFNLTNLKIWGLRHQVSVCVCVRMCVHQRVYVCVFTFLLCLPLNAFATTRGLRTHSARTRASWDLTSALSEIVATFGLADTLGRRIRKGNHKMLRRTEPHSDGGRVYKSGSNARNKPPKDGLEM